LNGQVSLEKLQNDKNNVLVTISETYEESEVSSIHRRKIKKGKLTNISIEVLKQLKIQSCDSSNVS